MIASTIFAYLFTRLTSQWPVPNKQQESPLEARLPESSLPQKQPVSRRLPLAVSRSLTGIDPEPSLFVRSDATRSQLSYSSASFLSSVLCVRLPRITRPIFVSRDQPSWPFRSLPRPTSSVFSRIPT